MEKTLVQVFNDAINRDGVDGCILADKQGLCMLASPNIKHELAGLITAVAQQASKIDTSDESPVICLENDKRRCIIISENGYTKAVFKNVSKL